MDFKKWKAFTEIHINIVNESLTYQMESFTEIIIIATTTSHYSSMQVLHWSTV